jgi:hypothetical protein
VCRQAVTFFWLKKGGKYSFFDETPKFLEANHKYRSDTIDLWGFSIKIRYGDFWLKKGGKYFDVSGTFRNSLTDAFSGIPIFTRE